MNGRLPVEDSSREHSEEERCPLSVPGDSYAEFEAFSRELDRALEELEP